MSPVPRDGAGELVRSMVCPTCRAALARRDDSALHCGAEGTTYRKEGGIWRMLDAATRASLAPFLARYRTVRRAERWGSDDAAYYRALPFEDRSRRHTDIWRIRAIGYRALVREVVPREPGTDARTILDLGAGNGWLSHRLAGLGHEVAAVDIDDDADDGLGAWPHYGDPPPFTPVQASFDRLPWPDGSADVVVYNGSLHYSADYRATLAEGRRVLSCAGRLAILDSPFYRRAESGAAMVRGRDETFRTDYGLEPAEPIHEGFLTRDRLAALGADLGITWRVATPWYGLRWALRPWANRLRGLREPMRFHVVIGHVDRAG